MDGLSAAASILGIATAGLQVSIKLVSFATQVGTASDRITAIGNDVSLVAGLLQQLGELMGEKTSEGGISIFNQAGLDTTMHSANMCNRIFKDLQQAVFKASTQLRESKKVMGGKFKLSATEKAKWPFLQPKIDMLRQDLQEAKGTLMLMLQVTSLAFSKRMARATPQSQSISAFDMESMVRTIVAIQHQQTFSDCPEPDTPKKNNTSNSESNDDSFNRTSNPVMPGSKGQPLICKKPGITTPTQLKDGKNTTLSKANCPSKPGVANSNARRLQGRSSTSSSQSSIPVSINMVSSTSSNTIPSDKWSTSTLVTPQETRPISSTAPEPQMVLLRPTLQDYFNRVELTWTKQTMKLPGDALQQHLSQGRTTLTDTLQDLHAYEQSIIDDAVHKHGEGALVVSAKRTKTDMSTRNIMFKELPGLQFVVHRSNEPLTSYVDHGHPPSDVVWHSEQAKYGRPKRPERRIEEVEKMKQYELNSMKRRCRRPRLQKQDIDTASIPPPENTEPFRRSSVTPHRKSLSVEGSYRTPIQKQDLTTPEDMLRDVSLSNTNLSGKFQPGGEKFTDKLLITTETNVLAEVQATGEAEVEAELNVADQHAEITVNEEVLTGTALHDFPTDGEEDKFLKIKMGDTIQVVEKSADIASSRLFKGRIQGTERVGLVFLSSTDMFYNSARGIIQRSELLEGTAEGFPSPGLDLTMKDADTMAFKQFALSQKLSTPKRTQRGALTVSDDARREAGKKTALSPRYSSAKRKAFSNRSVARPAKQTDDHQQPGVKPSVAEPYLPQNHRPSVSFVEPKATRIATSSHIPFDLERQRAPYSTVPAGVDDMNPPEPSITNIPTHEKQQELVPEAAVFEDGETSRNQTLRGHIHELNDMYLDFERTFDDYDDGDGDDHHHEEAFMDNDAEAKKLVDELLGKYTTYFC